MTLLESRSNLRHRCNRKLIDVREVELVVDAHEVVGKGPTWDANPRPAAGSSPNQGLEPFQFKG
jgi:hypothetical protein